MHQNIFPQQARLLNVSTVRAAVRAKVTSEFLVLRIAPSASTKFGLHELDNKHRCSVHRSKLIMHFGEVADCARQEAQTPMFLCESILCTGPTVRQDAVTPVLFAYRLFLSMVAVNPMRDMKEFYLPVFEIVAAYFQTLASY